MDNPKTWCSTWRRFSGLTILKFLTCISNIQLQMSTEHQHGTHTIQSYVAVFFTAWERSLMLLLSVGYDLYGTGSVGCMGTSSSLVGGGMLLFLFLRYRKKMIPITAQTITNEALTPTASATPLWASGGEGV